MCSKTSRFGEVTCTRPDVIANRMSLSDKIITRRKEITCPAQSRRSAAKPDEDGWVEILTQNEGEIV